MEINLLKRYPQVERKPEERQKSEYIQATAKTFSGDYFDGHRNHGYGGYYYNPKYWRLVAEDIVNHYGLKEGDSILDFGCGKGFLLYEFARINPHFELQGVDISSYAIENSLPVIRPHLWLGDQKLLHDFKDKEFTLALSINVLHNLEQECLRQALITLQAKSKQTFITLDAYRNEEERKKIEQWNLTAQTVRSVDEWKDLFKVWGYFSDWYYFFP